MENSIRVPANFAADRAISMTNTELLHHTLNLMLFSLGLGALFIGSDVTAATPFTSTLLQIPVVAAIIGASTLMPLNVPRWLQRGTVAAIYAALLIQQLPAETPAVTATLFVGVALTSFLAPTVMKLSKVSSTLAAAVVAGLVMVGLTV